MSGRLDSHGTIAGAVPLREVLSGSRIHRIPGFYQRDFCWSTEQGDEMLGDLLGVLDQRPDDHSPLLPYLLGMFVVADNIPAQGLPDVAGPGRVPVVVDVVDGQQRLTTLVILIACLRDRETEANLRDQLDRMIAAPLPNQGRTYTLVPKAGTAEFLATYVQAPGATNIPLVTPPTEVDCAGIANIRASYSTALETMSPVRRRSIATLLQDHCYVANVALPDPARAPEVFAQLNLRGRPLLISDRLKADVINAVQDSNRAECSATWDRVKSRLGDAFYASGGNRKNLFSHVSDLYGPSPKARIEDNIRGLIRMHGGEGFVERIFVPAGESLADINDAEFQGGAQSAEINAFLTYLNWLPQKEWLPPALHWIAEHRGDPVQVVKFLKALDRFAFGSMILGGTAGQRADRFDPITARLKKGGDVRLDDLFVITKRDLSPSIRTSTIGSRAARRSSFFCACTFACCARRRPGARLPRAK